MKKSVCSLCALLITCNIFAGCGSINKDASLVTVDGGADTVTLGLFNFAARYQQSILDLSYGSMMGDDMWTQDYGGSSGTMEDSTKESVLDSLKTQYVSRAHADDYDIKITDDVAKNIDAAVSEFLEENSKSAIREMGADEECVREFLELSYYEQKLMSAVRDEIDVNISDKDATQSTISYVYFSTEPTTDEETGESIERTDDEIEAIRELADEFAKAEDFEEASKNLPEEGTLSTYSYTASLDPSEDTSLGEKVIAAANELEDEEVSEVIEVKDSGFYIVRMDAKEDKEATETKRSELEDAERYNHYNEVIDGWKEELSWEVDEKMLAKVKFDRLFEMSSSMEEEIYSEE